MKKPLVIISAIILIQFTSCTSTEEKELSPQEKRANDSISKIEQKIIVDSLKKANPLLIMPPDSTYTGDYTDKYPSGIVKFKGFFRFGQRHGMWMSFYPNGLAWSEMHYDKGLRHGPNTTYYENGKMRFSGFYKLDVKDSVWTYYDSIGNMAEKILFKDDRMLRKLPLKQ
jgi:antitoxin component YwqK of YwqJK toxin-antitoxin module